tara:strand:- start:1192 stop:2232 length:1041 start_codon:yes stop_codon:yes gene_type:complete
MNPKLDIQSLSLKDLKMFCAENNIKEFRAKQIFEWIWKKRVDSFQEMTSLSIEIRDLLTKSFLINRVHIHKKQESKDQTIKYSLRTHDGLLLEAVLIPSKKRVTVCLSSQIGCSLSCNFCATGLLKLERNLSASEMYDQVYILNKESNKYFGKKISNIVFMGMGEPLLNYNELLKSINLITSSKGMGVSAKRITVSTAGIAKMIKKLADDNVRFNLAVSLHNAENNSRDVLMPINKKIPLKDLRESIKYFYNKTGTRITYEYILFKNINDSINDAKRLAHFTKNTPCKINLIEYNTVEGISYEKSKEKSTANFINYLEEKNLIVNLRKSKGKDIDAACGQLINRLK